MTAKIQLAYFPIIGRGQQILIICEEHDIEVEFLTAKPFGDDFDKDSQSPFGTLPWMRDPSNGVVLNDSIAIVQYLINQYEGPTTPGDAIEAAKAVNMWAWVQDYYSFVLSPFHDIITEHQDAFWRNLRLTDTLADGGVEEGVSKLTKLHHSRVKYLESVLQDMGSPQYLTGDSYTYADVFLYTCVRATQKCAGFKILRDSCGGDPFKGHENILGICDKVENRQAVKKSVGDKFEKAPI